MSHTRDKQPLLPLPVAQKFAHPPMVLNVGLRWRAEMDFADQEACLQLLVVHVRICVAPSAVQQGGIQQHLGTNLPETGMERGASS